MVSFESEVNNQTNRLLQDYLMHRISHRYLPRSYFLRYYKSRGAMVIQIRADSKEEVFVLCSQWFAWLKAWPGTPSLVGCILESDRNERFALRIAKRIATFLSIKRSILHFGKWSICELDSPYSCVLRRMKIALLLYIHVILYIHVYTLYIYIYNIYGNLIHFTRIF